MAACVRATILDYNKLAWKSEVTAVLTDVIFMTPLSVGGFTETLALPGELFISQKREGML